MTSSNNIETIPSIPIIGTNLSKKNISNKKRTRNPSMYTPLSFAKDKAKFSSPYT